MFYSYLDYLVAKQLFTSWASYTQTEICKVLGLFSFDHYFLQNFHQRKEHTSQNRQFTVTVSHSHRIISVKA